MGLGTEKTVIGGVPAYWDDAIGKYRYESDDSVIELDDIDVPIPHKLCPKCGLNPADFGGHDPCIANLPGVVLACCGHGVKKGSIRFENGIIIKGDFTIKKGKPYGNAKLQRKKGD